MLRLNEPFGVDGYVMSSHLVKPETAYLSDRTYYSVQLMLSEPGVIDDINRMFAEGSPLHQDLDVIGVDESSYSITAFTLNPPRLPKGVQGEYAVGTEIGLRIKADINEGSVSSTGRLLLVQVNELIKDEDIDWDSMDDYYSF